VDDAAGLVGAAALDDSGALDGATAFAFVVAVWSLPHALNVRVDAARRTSEALRQQITEFQPFLGMCAAARRPGLVGYEARMCNVQWLIVTSLNGKCGSTYGKTTNSRSAAATSTIRIDWATLALVCPGRCLQIQMYMPGSSLQAKKNAGEALLGRTVRMLW
jgi:hypothetical protein